MIFSSYSSSLTPAVLAAFGKLAPESLVRVSDSGLIPTTLKHHLPAGDIN
ncbi:hypothetical protein FORC065_3286 [Yersinia enterocolitica]|nr:hypothetical protein FORC065_3286 [Yersinia enterocolitica]